MKVRLISVLFLLTSLTVLTSVFLFPGPRIAVNLSPQTGISSVSADVYSLIRQDDIRLHLFGRGRINLTFEDVGLQQVVSENPEVREGGFWTPRYCPTHQSAVLVIPYRDRESHLTIFLRHMHPILQAQMLQYAILVIEQEQPEVFNRGALLNIGFLEARKLWPSANCIIFHDVDLLPENLGNLYRCMENPLHIGAFVDKANYTAYITIVGGALAMRPSQVISVNGFSNTFWGWGGEDDDMYNRITHYRHLRISYPDQILGRMTMIKHNRDLGNPVNPDRTKGRKPYGTKYAEDGVNSVQYDISKIDKLSLFTKIRIQIKSASIAFYE